MQVWFDKGYFTCKLIGIAEWNGNRVLIRDTDTIEIIEKALKTLKAYTLS